jgi:hypothetical protein
MEIVLHKEDDHGVRGDSGVKGGISDPQSENSFSTGRLDETIKEASVRVHAIGIRDHFLEFGLLSYNLYFIFYNL